MSRTAWWMTFVSVLIQPLFIAFLICYAVLDPSLADGKRLIAAASSLVLTGFLVRDVVQLMKSLSPPANAS